MIGFSADIAEFATINPSNVAEDTVLKIFVFFINDFK